MLEFDRKGYLYDLSDMDFIHNLSADALQQSTYDNKVFSLPLSYTAFGLLWNVDLLHQYDLEVPQTLSEFLTVCEMCIRDRAQTSHSSSFSQVVENACFNSIF